MCELDAHYITARVANSEKSDQPRQTLLWCPTVALCAPFLFPFHLCLSMDPWLLLTSCLQQTKPLHSLKTNHLSHRFFLFVCVSAVCVYICR